MRYASQMVAKDLRCFDFTVRKHNLCCCEMLTALSFGQIRISLKCCTNEVRG